MDYVAFKSQGRLHDKELEESCTPPTAQATEEALSTAPMANEGAGSSNSTELEIIKEALERAGLPASSSAVWTGPLPPQVFRNMPPETADYMVRSYCDQQSRNNDIAMTMIEAKVSESKDRKWLIISTLFIIFISFLFFAWMCLQSGNPNLIEAILDKIAYLLGGGAIGALIISKGQSDSSSLTIEAD